jgi:hypothetical protein
MEFESTKDEKEGFLSIIKKMDIINGTSKEDLGKNTIKDVVLKFFEKYDFDTCYNMKENKVIWTMTRL